MTPVVFHEFEMLPHQVQLRIWRSSQGWRVETVMDKIVDMQSAWRASPMSAMNQLIETLDRRRTQLDFYEEIVAEICVGRQKLAALSFWWK